MGEAIATGDRVYLPQLQTFGRVTGWVVDGDNPHTAYHVRTEEGRNELVPSWQVFAPDNVQPLLTSHPHEWFSRMFPMPRNDGGTA